MIAAPGHSKLSKGILLALWAVWQGMLLLLCISSARTGALVQGLGVMLFLSLAGTFYALKHLATYPTVMFDEKGVHYEIASYKRFYPWEELTSVGLLWIKNKTGRYEALTLVKPGGKPWDGDPGALRFHNRGKIIFLPVTEEAVDYVEAHYGPLDFDLVTRK